MPIEPRIAVLIPCRNEALTVARVVADFRACLPTAKIYVYDNNSSDGTAAAAAGAGAIVRRETLPGKGSVVRRMFADIEADAYVMVDGDNTYDTAGCADMVRLLLDQQLDMVNGRRTEPANGAAGAYRRGHRAGNVILSGMVRLAFGSRIEDILSGYRVFSRRFVKTFPAHAAGFETETEFTIHALDLLMPVAELPVGYRERASGSVSKLRTYSDGLRILRTIILLIKEERPLPFFTAAGAVLLLIAIVLGTPIVATYFLTGLVPRLPTALLAVGIVVVAFLSVSCGLILDSVARARRESKRFAYLAIPRWEPGE